MRRRHIIALFVSVGVLLEIAAFYVGIVYTGVKDFGSVWPLAIVYHLGLWPDWVFSSIPATSPWSILYLVAPLGDYPTVDSRVRFC